MCANLNAAGVEKAIGKERATPRVAPAGRLGGLRAPPSTHPPGPPPVAAAAAGFRPGGGGGPCPSRSRLRPPRSLLSLPLPSSSRCPDFADLAAAGRRGWSRLPPRRIRALHGRICCRAGCGGRAVAGAGALGRAAAAASGGRPVAAPRRRRLGWPARGRAASPPPRVVGLWSRRPSPLGWPVGLWSLRRRRGPWSPVVTLLPQGAAPRGVATPPPPSWRLGGRGPVSPPPPRWWLVDRGCAALVEPGRRLGMAWRFLLLVKTMSVLRTGDDGA